MDSCVGYRAAAASTSTGRTEWDAPAALLSARCSPRRSSSMKDLLRDSELKSPPRCKNGGCCDRVQGTCPSCRDPEPIGVNRCRPLESAIAAMLFPYGFSGDGCEQRLRYAGRRAHGAIFCRHAPCACRFPGCAYAGRLLHDHIRDAHQDGAGGEDDAAAVGFVREAMVTLHRSMVFRVLLHAPDSRVFLLLNGGGVPSGRSLLLPSVGPRPAGDRALEYIMAVRAGGERDPGGAHSLSASGPVPCTRRWAGPDGHLPAEGFLFVPDAYWSSSGSVSVTVHVRKLIVEPAVDKP
ncbi:hypothetical protein BAE44_0018073 [Dichanthelium oligosanthes]|uniref:SIAH-type domain-containing protein n=1 Tax=Dichanthelium oligosanthes TaxID=888268 RepID=A0A1E5V721_9POAL|nr:hypothetical protein BAE44_0018073 [Dichanthelium oligosanthes]